MRNTFIFLFIFLIFFTLVIFIFFNKNKINYNVLEYGYETKIYIDRDYIISNNGTFEELQDQVADIRDWKTGEFKSTLRIV